MVGLLFVLLLHIPNVFQAGTVSNLWLKAFKQSTYEQEVEDINSIHKYDSHLVRRLIVMPLTEVFNPNRMDAMHNKVQYGDKCSLPSSLGKIIFEKPFEVPWLFEITPVQNKNDSKRDNRTYEQASISDDTSDTTSNGESSTAVQPPKLLRKRLQKAYISPLDFRSPENFIFVPKWLMADLNLKPNDLVDISFVRIRLASLVTLQPLTLEWDTLMRVHGDPKSLLEHEINKYSSLTSGSTIIIEIKSVEYPIFVKEVTPNHILKTLSKFTTKLVYYNFLRLRLRMTSLCEACVYKIPILKLI